VSQDGSADCAANDGVQAGAVSSAVGNADTFYGWGHAISVMRQATGPLAQELYSTLKRGIFDWYL
jgi:hypothetical protein